MEVGGYSALIIQNAPYVTISCAYGNEMEPLTQKCSLRCRGRSHPCSRRDDSRTHGAPSIPACSCHSGDPRRRAYKCTPRCRGHRERPPQSAQSLQGGRSRLRRRRRGTRVNVSVWRYKKATAWKHSAYIMYTPPTRCDLLQHCSSSNRSPGLLT